jgi:mediator of RNA polymerase II transcription subunit 12
MISQPSTGTQVPGPHHPRPLNRPVLPSKLSTVNLSRQNDLADVDEANRSAYTANGMLQYTAQPVNTPDEPTQHIPPRLLSQRTTQLPLPRRPQSLIAQGQARPIIPKPTPTPVLDPSTRANGLQPPAVATRLPRDKAADFFPWTNIEGKHPEDVLNEHLIKSGFSDKPAGASQQESNMARPHLWPSLKNKNGLSVLSALFVQVLDKRSQMRLCTAPSTFKPPPRVTLTDTKREAWLKDLANPEVPLRKLSRTIPHGIRGKVLLDHCITKDIPIARAVWLSKCVGANEIRAFKRKGVSGPAALAGELKWIREWTVFVEQFVDGIIASCGQPGWSRKMNYAVRLGTQFYVDHLLDEEHYMDWILTSLKHSYSERLPVWILLIQIYWKHLISHRNRGHRLAEALLGHAKALAATPYGINLQLTTRINQLINILAVNHRGCLVLPKSWNEYKATFAAVKPTGRMPLETHGLTNVARRNNRISGASPQATSRTPKLRLIDILDSVGLDVHIDKIAAQCELLGFDTRSMLVTILEWAASKHRSGVARVYLAAQLIRYWSFAGFSADDAVLTMLEKARNDRNMEPRLIYKLVSALARSGHFSVGRYLQWLISMGVLSGSNAGASEAQLLLELPTAYLSSHIVNLRRTLLNRVGYHADAETREVENYKTVLSQHLGGMSLPSPGVASQEPVLNSKPVGAVRMAVAQWLCERVVSQNFDSVSDTVFNGNLAAFCLVRHTLEQFEDYPSLAKVLAAASSCSNPQILAATADTINLNIDIFATMGFLPALVSQIYQQQRRLRSRQPLDRTFLLSLSGLVRRVPSGAMYAKTLDSEIAICEIQSSTTACSPASDSMAISHSGSLESNDDIDRVLTSGNTMDEQLMVRMFTTIADRSVKMGSEGLSRAGAWFTQLRSFDQTTFEQLVQKLVTRMAEAAAPYEAVEGVIASLVGSNCLKLDTFCQIWEKKLNTIKATEPTNASRLATICARILIPTTSVTQNQSAEAYRFKVAQNLFCREQKASVLRIVGLLLQPSSQSILSTDGSDLEEKVTSLLRGYIVSDYKMVSQELVCKNNTIVAQTTVQPLLDSLLDFAPQEEQVRISIIDKVNKIVASTTELSLPFSQLALQQLSSTLSGGNSLSEIDKTSLVRTFQNAIEHASSVWPQLLSALDKDLIHHIHSWAGECVLEKLSSIISADGSMAEEAAVRRYLKAVEASALAASSQAMPSTAFPLLVEYLKRLGQFAESINPLDPTQSDKKVRMAFGINVLLQLTTMHHHTLQDVNAYAQDLIPLMGVLCALLIHPKLQAQQTILEHILDVASMISDDLANEHMHMILRNLPPQARCIPRLRYLFGTHTSPDAWLSLASKVVPASAAQQNPTSTPLQISSSPISATQSPSMLQRPWPVPARPGMPARPPSNVNTPVLSQAHLQQQQVQQQRLSAGMGMNRGPVELKQTPYMLRRWELMPDPTPIMGANDTSLSLGLFQARKCV